MAEQEEKGMVIDLEGSGDNTDAGKVLHSQRYQVQRTLLQLPTGIDALDYNMNYKERGLLLIFNHKNFCPSLKVNPRNGTDADRDNAKAVFEKLGFQVRVYDDLKHQAVVQKIRDAAEEDHTDRACFACIVLSHGEEGLIYANDLIFKSSSFWEPFLGDECQTLAGKPKLFFIQACQGSKVDCGVSMVTTDSVQVVKIPSHADFLIACSTVPGYYSWRNTSEGSWFIQALCQVLAKFHDTMHLLDMMTLVNQTVAYYFQSNTSDPSMHQKKQIPCISTMLTRRLYLSKRTPSGVQV